MSVTKDVFKNLANELPRMIMNRDGMEHKKRTAKVWF